MTGPADKTLHRPHRRYVFPADAPVAVELPDPGSTGSRIELRLIDLSATGISFETGREAFPWVAGDTVDGAVVRVGRHRIAGSVVVARVDGSRPGRRVCGAAFRPASARADAALRAVLAWLDALESRPAASVSRR